MGYTIGQVVLRPKKRDPLTTSRWSSTSTTTYLNHHMKPFKKGHAWWIPPHNFAFNAAIMNVNLWYFTILPNFSHAYLPASSRYPEGIVIDPNWASFKDGGGLSHTVKTAELGVKLAKSRPSIAESVKKDLEHIESKFNVQIPQNTVSQLVSDAPKVAERRWGTDRLRRKKILVPFDGSKSIEMSSF